MSDWLGFDPTPYSPQEWWIHVKNIPNSKMTWHPMGICLHATGLPTLEQWVELGPKHDQRLKNLEHYYQGMGWQHGPHAFVSRSHVNGFSALTSRGTHSRCYNATHFGIEQAGNFNTGHDDYNSGDGAMVKAMAVLCLAALCKRFSIDPKYIVPHSSCKIDGHFSCPGNEVSMSEVINNVTKEIGKLAMVLMLLFTFGVMGRAHAATCTTPNLGTDAGLAQALVKLGFLQSGTIQPDQLTAAIQVFQGQNSLTQDGIAGAFTRDALSNAYCEAGPLVSPTNPTGSGMVADLSAAIKVAQQPPVLLNEVNCFTKLHDDLSATENLPSGAGLFTAYVVLIRKQAVLSDLQTDSCLAVCGRAQQVVSLPIFSRIIPVNLIPNICQLAKLFTP